MTTTKRRRPGTDAAAPKTGSKGRKPRASVHVLRLVGDPRAETWAHRPKFAGNEQAVASEQAHVLATRGRASYPGSVVAVKEGASVWVFGDDGKGGSIPRSHIPANELEQYISAAIVRGQSVAVGELTWASSNGGQVRARATFRVIQPPEGRKPGRQVWGPAVAIEAPRKRTAKSTRGAGADSAELRAMLAMASVPAPWVQMTEGLGEDALEPFHDFKRANPGALVFFGIEGWYYLAGDDAKRADALVGWRIVQASNGLHLARVGSHYLEDRIGELLQAGASVGVVEIDRVGLGDRLYTSAGSRAR